MKSLFLTVFTFFLSFAAFTQQLSKEEIQTLAKEQTAELTAHIRLDATTEQRIHNYNLTGIFNGQQIPADDKDALKLNNIERFQSIRNAIPEEQLKAFDEFSGTSKFYQPYQK